MMESFCNFWNNFFSFPWHQYNVFELSVFSKNLAAAFAKNRSTDRSILASGKRF